MNKKKRDLPLSPYRVLDLTNEKGCFCGKILADLGADVIKIEPPEGDPGRNIGPFYHGQQDKEKSLFFFAYNANKRSITLNIKTREGQEILKGLAKTADFVMESFGPGYMDGMGLGYSVLNGINPRVIMVSITPFGQEGPYKNWKASDIVAIAMGGLSHITGSPDRPPARVSVDQAHVVAGAQGAMGAMIAHYYREANGKGQYIDTSTQESVVLSALTVPQAWDLQKFIWPREGAFMSRARKRVRHLWPCKDGYIAWRLFTGGLGVKTRAMVDWMKSQGKAGELAEINWQELDLLTVPEEKFYHWQELFGEFFKTRTKAELCGEALARGIVLIPASTPKDLLADPQLEARDYWEEVEHAELGTTITYPGGLYKSSEMEWKFRRAPLVGEHNREIYEGELGITKERLAALKQSGII
ncbi:MAG TPA: CaiB/BaiF CoA-transferase family protein [Thermodesulfobacteriota bacterium]|nr:CaiB/BaiF CoA-transferase family protein [Thermodesulfobacteriota bacterium]